MLKLEERNYEDEKDNPVAKGGEIPSDSGTESEVSPHTPTHFVRNDVRTGGR